MPTRKRQLIVVEIEGDPSANYTLFPKTQDEIRKALKTAGRKAGVKGEYDLAVCRAAFIAAGIERASELKVRAVRPRHIWEGYNKHFRISLEHPLFKCIPTSVLGRVETLKHKSSVFRGLIDRVEE